MTTPIKTQCPHCHTIFNIKHTQLNQKTATVCCEHCQQIFLVNNNLIVTADIDNNRKLTGAEAYSDHDERTNTTTSHTTHSTLSTANADDADILIHDDMIHDDMDIEAPYDKSLEYDSLDSMDAWLTQATDNNNNATPSEISQKNTAKKLDKHSDVSTDLFETTSTSATASNRSHSSAKIALSSTAANSIHANIDDKADESWLEKLLKEQNSSEDTPTNDTDLSQLLLSMGVDFKEEDRSKAAHAKRLQAQAKFSPMPSRRSAASLLWIFGCLVLTLLLFAQYVIFNLNNLVKNPAYAERLQTICTIAACSLPSADLTALTMSDIRYRASRINSAADSSDISATLNNQSLQAQLYPHIKVSVYGANALIGEFIASPDEYLASTQSQLAASGEKQLLFTIPVTNTQITKVVIHPIY
ncbi:zinc-ribbon and DUF3426 domain-containing protein [Psychrobacter glacincola]|uniref:Zinc-ribbon and DUF3426 domain-containing protein n=1 Tax=Psychrobacter glacincola TaxID=56810 RepID=A0ABW1W8D2_9GAMM|nr:zinc-ribbon and DUF3426 domain-containing protein [Psychrobacter glacincola]